MAKWRKRESLGKVLAREGKGIAKGVAKELLSIAILGFYSPKKYRPYPKREGKRGASSGPSRSPFAGRGHHGSACSSAHSYQPSRISWPAG